MNVPGLRMRTVEDNVNDGVTRVVQVVHYRLQIHRHGYLFFEPVNVQQLLHAPMVGHRERLVTTAHDHASGISDPFHLYPNVFIYKSYIFVAFVPLRSGVHVVESRHDKRGKTN